MRKLVSSVRINQNVVYPTNLDKQKVAPALALFSPEITSALKLEFGEQAKGTCLFLEFMNSYVIQPLLITNSHKVKKCKYASPFFTSADPRLLHFKEIADWSQDSWCQSLTKDEVVSEH